MGQIITRYAAYLSTYMILNFPLGVPSLVEDAPELLRTAAPTVTVALVDSLINVQATAFTE